MGTGGRRIAASGYKCSKFQSRSRRGAGEGDLVRSVVSRLARLERLNRLSTAPQRLRIQYGYLKTLPDDDIGPRHVVTVKQLPPSQTARIGSSGKSALDRSRPQRPAAPPTISSSESATWRERRPESTQSPARPLPI